MTKGKYSVQYGTTKAGPLTVFSSLAVSGGVYATYYDGVSATYYQIPMKAEAVSQFAPSTYDGAPAYTVRWAGLFRPEDVTEHTFTPLASATRDKNDRVKLWLDTKLIIDQWSSLTVAIPTATLSFPVANEYYEIEMVYQVGCVMLACLQRVLLSSALDDDGPRCEFDLLLLEHRPQSP